MQLSLIPWFWIGNILLCLEVHLFMFIASHGQRCKFHLIITLKDYGRRSLKSKLIFKQNLELFATYMQ